MIIAAQASCRCGDESLDTFAPRLRISPEALDFGGRPLGATTALSVVVINDGNAPLELTGEISLAGDAGLSLEGTGAFPVPGGGFTEIRVAFAPEALGPAQGVVKIPLAPPLSPVEIPLSAEGLPAELEIDPAELDLGEVVAGARSTARATVRSLSDAALDVTLSVAGEGFLLEREGQQPVSQLVVELPAFGEVPVEVVFAPAGGGDYEARLVAELCGPGCGPAAILRGVGLAPRIGVAPRPVELGEVASGAVASADLRVENRGVGTLTLLAISLADPEGQLELVAPDLPVDLAAGQELPLEVRFEGRAPVAAYEGTLLIDSNDPLSPRVQVAVRASTPGAALRAIPTALHYGRVDPGSIRALDVVALSAGTAPVTLEQVALGGDDPAAFALVTPPPTLPYTLAPGESLLLIVEARPEARHLLSGGASASLVLSPTEGEAATAHLTFASGDEGCQPRAPLHNLSLGSVRVGQGVQGTLVLVNEGTAPCTLALAGPAPGLPFEPGFQMRHDGIVVLEPGAQGTVSFGYQAHVSGLARAFVRIAFEEQPEPLFLSATARGVLGNLVPEPPLLVLGPFAEGCFGDAASVSFVNDGAESVRVTALELAPAGAPFSLEPEALPATILPGGLLEVRVTPITDSAGHFQASLIASTEELGDVPAQLDLVVVVEGDPITETFHVGDRVHGVDILFIVDNSGSMLDDQDTLAENFASFLAAAGSGATSDFHLAVTSTDVVTAGALKGALRGPPQVLTPSTPSLESVFADHVRIGAEGAPIELGLEAMRLALSEPLVSGANAGFLRTDAALSIVVVSDEDDSGGYDLTGIYGGDTRSVAGYASFLRGVKGGSLSNVPTLFSVVGVGGERYRQMVDAFGGVELSITDPDWGTALGEIGEVTFALQRTFRLAERPDPSSVTVDIDGTPTTSFSLDETAVVLDDVPPPGATVTITYRADCAP